MTHPPHHQPEIEWAMDLFFAIAFGAAGMLLVIWIAH